MQPKRISILYLLLAAIFLPSTLGQGSIGNELPCGVDNLSCPRIENTPLECYNMTMLCDGMDFCTGGSDEGRNLVSLDCKCLSLCHHYLID